MSTVCVTLPAYHCTYCLSRRARGSVQPDTFSPSTRLGRSLIHSVNNLIGHDAVAMSRCRSGPPQPLALCESYLTRALTLGEETQNFLHQCRSRVRSSLHSLQCRVVEADAAECE